MRRLGMGSEGKQEHQGCETFLCVFYQTISGEKFETKRSRASHLQPLSSVGSADFLFSGTTRTLSHHSVVEGNSTQWRGRGGDGETEGGKDQGREGDRCYLSVS